MSRVFFFIARRRWIKVGFVRKSPRQSGVVEELETSNLADMKEINHVQTLGSHRTYRCYSNFEYDMIQSCLLLIC